MLEEHHCSSYGWALSCCRYDRDEAEDVLQTVYLKICSGKARFGGRSQFRTWLFAVIRRTAADARRRHALRRLMLRHQAESSPDRLAVGRPGGEDQRFLNRESLRRALATLSVRQREVIQLVFYHELSLQEASEVMAVSVGSARTHYHRAKQRLRKELGSGGSDGQ